MYFELKISILIFIYSLDSSFVFVTLFLPDFKLLLIYSTWKNISFPLSFWFLGGF